MLDRSFVDILSSQRSVRRFTDQAIPNEVLREIMEIALKAPNGSNNQGWRFLVVTAPDQRRRMGELYIKALESLWVADSLEQLLQEPDLNTMQKGGIRMALEMPERPPVQVLACFERQNGYDPAPSIYPAVQNMMLAAWRHGIGTVLTTGLHRRMEAEIREVLGIPSDILIYAFVPMGYPSRPYGPPKRKPVDEVTFVDRWGSATVL